MQISAKEQARKGWERGRGENSNNISRSLRDILVPYVSADGQTKGLYTRFIEIKLS